MQFWNGKYASAAFIPTRFNTLITTTSNGGYSDNGIILEFNPATIPPTGRIWPPNPFSSSTRSSSASSSLSSSQYSSSISSSIYSSSISSTAVSSSISSSLFSSSPVSSSQISSSKFSSSALSSSFSSSKPQFSSSISSTAQAQISSSKSEFSSSAMLTSSVVNQPMSSTGTATTVTESVSLVSGLLSSFSTASLPLPTFLVQLQTEVASILALPLERISVSQVGFPYNYDSSTATNGGGAALPPVARNVTFTFIVRSTAVNQSSELANNFISMISAGAAQSSSSNPLLSTVSSSTLQTQSATACVDERGNVAICQNDSSDDKKLLMMPFTIGIIVIAVVGALVISLIAYIVYRSTKSSSNFITKSSGSDGFSSTGLLPGHHRRNTSTNLIPNPANQV